MKLYASNASKEANGSNEFIESDESKVGPKARTVDSLASLDADPGPNRMHLLVLKSPPPRPGL